MIFKTYVVQNLVSYTKSEEEEQTQSTERIKIL